MYTELKRVARAVNLLLPRLGLVDMTFGNVSVADRARGVLAIKPSGIAYDAMTPEDIVIVDFDGKVVEGDRRPSSDTPTHLVLYRAWPQIGAVVHTHSRYATSFAQAGRAIECFGTTHADAFHGPVPVTRPLTKEEVGGDYETATGRVIVERFAEAIDPVAVPAVLVAGHGVFAWGATGEKAVENACVLERVAEMALNTLALRPEARPLADYLLDKHHERKHGKDAYYGQDEEPSGRA
jgi:L-ribulose-5-phosphate 4-epimerase